MTGEVTWRLSLSLVQCPQNQVEGMSVRTAQQSVGLEHRHQRALWMD